MHKLIVSLPTNREFEGSLTLEEENGRVLAGPFPVCGLADRAAAGRHGNPSGHALLPFGDTPLGRYRVAGIQATGPRTSLPAEQFGPHGVIVLTPTAGDAALADANGRFCIVIQGGTLAQGRRLRPTNGALRLTDKDQRTLVRTLRRSRRPCVCECVTAAQSASVRTVAQAVPYESVDPPVSVAAVTLPIAAATAIFFVGDRFSPGQGRSRRSAGPSFRLAAGGGGASAAGGGGYGSEPDIPPDPAASAAAAADLTSTAADLATDNAADYAVSGSVTQCSKFVRDFATTFVGSDDPLPELQGQVKDQVSALASSSDWTALDYKTDQQAALTQAQADANAGKLVVVAWVNPSKTDTDTGHIAVVVPNPPSTASPDGTVASGKWGMDVPYIAQAGKTVTPKTPLSYGFGQDKQATLQIFVRDK